MTAFQTNDYKTLLSRNDSDIIKGIAILLVVSCHLGNNFIRFLTPLGGIGVALFLILSAYGLEKAFMNFGLKAFWRKRLVTVFVPYWIIEFIAYAAKLIQFQGGRSLLFDLTLINPQFPLGWYLNYLLLWYVIFWLIHIIPAFSENKKYRVLAFVVVSLTLLGYFNFTSSLRFEQSFSFLIGIWLANNDEKLCSDGIKIAKYRVTKDKLIRLSYGLIFLFIAFIILAAKQTSFVRGLSDTDLNIVDLGIKLFASIGIMICILAFDETEGWFRRFWNLIKRILIPVGKASFELYLVHGYALAVFSVVWNHKSLCVLTFLSISIVGTFAFHLFNLWLGGTLKGNLIKKSDDGGFSRAGGMQ